MSSSSSRKRKREEQDEQNRKERRIEGVNSKKISQKYIIYANITTCEEFQTDRKFIQVFKAPKNGTLWGIKYTFIYYYNANMVRQNPWNNNTPEIDNKPLSSIWILGVKENGRQIPPAWIPLQVVEQPLEFKNASSIIAYDIEQFKKEIKFPYKYNVPATENSMDITGSGSTTGAITGTSGADSFEGEWNTTAMIGEMSTEAHTISRDKIESTNITDLYETTNAIWKFKKVKGQTSIKRDLNNGDELILQIQSYNLPGEVQVTIQYFFSS